MEENTSSVMHKHLFPALLGIVLIIIGSVYFFTQRTSVSSDTLEQGAQVATTTPDTTAGANEEPVRDVSVRAPSSFTAAEVAAHASTASCWTSVSGNVYDVTAWIAQHPGGREAILRLCGTDGTAAFTAKHGGQSRPEEELATFKIGTLSR